MSDLHVHFDNARNAAIDVLKKTPDRTAERIRAIAKIAAQGQRLFAPDADIDEEALASLLLHMFSVAVDAPTALDDAKDHVPWLPAKRGQIEWRFWDRYKTYLERDFGMPPTVVDSLHTITDMVLERLEDPDRPGPWDRRGMVVGSVQSGKTANYTGLICKALDAGYRLIIVLAGVHSNLRAQTQLRLDEGVLGFDTQKNRTLANGNKWIGVGSLPGERLVVHSLTSSEEHGDFNGTVANNTGVMIGGDPVLLVVKKNSSVLKNLKKWALHVAAKEDPTGKRKIDQVPLLLIDDEADNASINTRKDPQQINAINGHIRALLDAFTQSAYVGYTATPFANIFINPDAESPTHGEDLFPRSFIINVKPPSNYTGPAAVFGLDGDADADVEPRKSLPIVKTIDDYEVAFPPKHKRDHRPEALPESLKRAIRCFILTCAARAARGQSGRHNSMLIHVTRFVDVQGAVQELVQREVTALVNRLRLGDGKRSPTLREELRELWLTEFVPTTRLMRAADPSLAEVEWEAVDAELRDSAAKFQVMAINGFAKEVLDYKDNERNGLNVIAIGGDKLSRGLTLEGLSVSYFLRTSRMYDTLLQMGRWFGYRPGYLDLCRLFTTTTLVAWYRHIALAEQELRREFDYMVAAGLSPENYGLRVRTHPDGMTVTAMNKMSHGRKLELSWQGVLVQTAHLPKVGADIANNWDVTEHFVRSLGPLHKGDYGPDRVWKGEFSKSVADYVEALKYPLGSARANGERLAHFIRSQADNVPSELEEWTIVLVSTSRRSDGWAARIGDHEIGLTERSGESQTGNSVVLRKSNILNPEDESTDFRSEIFSQAWCDAVVAKRELADDVDWLRTQVGRVASDVALDLTRRWQAVEPPKLKASKGGDAKRPNGRVVRVLRNKKNGLLLIYPVRPIAEIPNANPDVKELEQTGLHRDGTPLVGIALSFPASDSALRVEYMVNQVWDREVGDDQYEDL